MLFLLDSVWFVESLHYVLINVLVPVVYFNHSASSSLGGEQPPSSDVQVYEATSAGAPQNGGTATSQLTFVPNPSQSNTSGFSHFPNTMYVQ